MRALLLCLLLLPAAHAQSSDNLHGSTYEDRSIGFRLDFPEPWKPVTSTEEDPNVTVHLALRRATEPRTLLIFKSVAFDGTPTLSADKSKSYAETVTDADNASVTRDPVRTIIGGLDLYRTDLRTDDPDKRFLSVLTIAIRNRIEIFEISGGSQRELDAAVAMLATSAHFTPDYEAPGVKSTAIPPLTRTPAAEFAELNHALAPLYPADAKAARISATLRFNIEVSEKGRADRIWLVEVSPELAEPTRDAGHYQSEFVKIALGEIAKQQFHPSGAKGKSTRYLAPFTVSFNLE